MKQWCIKYVVLLLMLLAGNGSFVLAQQELTIDSLELKRLTAYEKRMKKYHERWNSLIPRYTKLQYAGSMGFISLGLGWDYGKNKQWETDFMIGYVPRYTTSSDKLTFTLKQNFIPWKLDVGKKNKNFMFEPLACGIYINTMFGHNFWSKEPDRDSSGYYSFATKLRFNFYLGQRITYKLKQNRRLLGKSVTFFYEFSSNDIYIAQAATNSYLKPKDYIHLSLGLKFQFL